MFLFNKPEEGSEVISNKLPGNPVSCWAADHTDGSKELNWGQTTKILLLIMNSYFHIFESGFNHTAYDLILLLLRLVTLLP